MPVKGTVLFFSFLISDITSYLSCIFFSDIGHVWIVAYHLFTCSDSHWTLALIPHINNVTHVSCEILHVLSKGMMKKDDVVWISSVVLFFIRIQSMNFPA